MTTNIPALALAFWLASAGVASAEAVTGQATAHDGDDLIVNGQDFRLADIDAFEEHQLCMNQISPQWECGEEAKKALAKIVDRQTVTCDPTGKKSGNRLVAFCSIGSLNIQEEMVRRGWAFVRPDFAGPRTPALCSLEASAAQRKVGLWGRAWTDQDRPYFVKYRQSGSRG